MTSWLDICLLIIQLFAKYIQECTWNIDLKDFSEHKIIELMCDLILWNINKYTLFIYLLHFLGN